MGPRRRLLAFRTLTSSQKAPESSRLLGEGSVQLSPQLKGAVAVIAHWVIACANQPLTRAITPWR